VRKGSKKLKPSIAESALLRRPVTSSSAEAKAVTSRTTIDGALGADGGWEVESHRSSRPLTEEARMQQESARKILAASFTTPDGGSRGAGALGGAIRDKIGNTAVLYVRPDGKAKFVESKDWGAGRGALLGGAIGILGGPLGIIAGGSIGALVSKLRDSGFKNDQLEQLGGSLEPNSSAIVVEISSDAIDTAKELLEPLGAQNFVVEDLDENVASLFAQDAEPEAEPEPAATSSESSS
jgi:uncharacterized membrane protein